jgi:hypothetical protein
MFDFIAALLPQPTPLEREPSASLGGRAAQLLRFPQPRLRIATSTIHG